ncbi:MAG TPA: hypothetical protein VN873_20580 [Candidatus Angelobacter sp.]|nr:hypothetical protein [Candidatus Angelobacter sp.]
MKARSLPKSVPPVFEPTKVKLLPKPVHHLEILARISIKRVEYSSFEKLDERATRRTSVLEGILTRTEATRLR